VEDVRFVHHGFSTKLFRLYVGQSSYWGSGHQARQVMVMVHQPISELQTGSSVAVTGTRRWLPTTVMLNQLQPRYLPQSPMGQAISYALNQWPTLERFLEHGEVEIDNNRVENAIRPTAIGKKNWLFFGSEEAGARSAVMYTLP